MSALYCFDAAYAPDLAKVRAAGGVAINGYLTGQYAGTTTQPAAARAAGLGWVPTYEEWPSELVGASRATGQAVAQRILAAFQHLGIPLDGTVAVYPSVDVRDDNPTDCNTAWQGIRDVIAGKISVRVYAEGAVIDALTKAGLLDGPGWLSASSSFPGYDVNDPNICMVQLTGQLVPGTDADHLITDPHALGAWWPDGSPYGADMALTTAQAGQLADAARFAAAADTRAQALQSQVVALTQQVQALQTAVAALQPASTSGALQVTGTLNLSGGTA